MKSAELDRVGCFEYSPVQGATANDLKETPVPDEVKHERRERFMKLAAQISARRLKKKVGRTLQVLIDKIEGETAIARSASDAPEIDGVVRILDAAGLKVGDLAEVKIIKSGAYDLEARPVR
jgi:ribosomal protein S12 methylthiotransferase